MVSKDKKLQRKISGKENAIWLLIIIIRYIFLYYEIIILIINDETDKLLSII